MRLSRLSSLCVAFTCMWLYAVQRPRSPLISAPKSPTCSSMGCQSDPSPPMPLPAPPPFEQAASRQQGRVQEIDRRATICWRELLWPQNRSAGGPVGTECNGHGVYNPCLRECRCTAGWDGVACELRSLRHCNSAIDGQFTSRAALCAGDCDDERGLCYCAGLAHRFQRPLPHQCQPWAAADSKLPDGRPLYPSPDASWRPARLFFERGAPWHGRWSRPFMQPLDYVYVAAAAAKNETPIPDRLNRPRLAPGQHAWCDARASMSPLGVGGAHACMAQCYPGRAGPMCEGARRTYCPRDCMDRGRCVCMYVCVYVCHVLPARLHGSREVCMYVCMCVCM